MTNAILGGITLVCLVVVAAGVFRMALLSHKRDETGAEQ